MTDADSAGLDEDGIVALFTSALRDFPERREGRDRGGAASDGRRASHEHHRDPWPRQALRRHAGPCATARSAIPEGHVAALVGPNGAGKSTLLNLVVGLAAPTAGGVAVLDGMQAGSPAALDGIAFVAQDMPLYRNLSAADLLHLTRNLNRRFDGRYARGRLDDLGIPLRHKAGKLSGGQQAQLALTLALARRPRLLVLDEPTALLDPLARHDFMATVMTAMAEDGISVLLSSHVLAELERVADYLVLLSRGRVRLDGAVDDLLAATALSPARPRPNTRRPPSSTPGAHRGADPPPGPGHRGHPVPVGWEAQPVGLEELRLPTCASPAPRRSQARPAAGRQTALSDDHDGSARPSGSRTRAAAAALAAAGLGHLAAAPILADPSSRATGPGWRCTCDRRTAMHSAYAVGPPATRTGSPICSFAW